MWTYKGEDQPEKLSIDDMKAEVVNCWDSMSHDLLPSLIVKMLRELKPVSKPEEI